MASADRQMIMETNRSIRNIKTELENLLEKGVIDESVFDTIHATLPAESPLSGPLRTASSNTARANDTPASTNGPTNAPPTEAFNRLNVADSRSPGPSVSPGPGAGPPSYDETPAPSMPPRRAEKPVIANARALYRYAGAEARDLLLERDDKIAVHSYMNDDWWMGQNLRTGNEGIFPRNYVLVESENKGPPTQQQAWPQQPSYGYPAQQQYGPPAQQNPYNSSVPPVAIAEGGQSQHEGGGQGDKVGQYGKKFGKKLGNAAIFGAGATIGGNIVNSIF
jgi:hypothetical protein